MEYINVIYEIILDSLLKKQLFTCCDDISLIGYIRTRGNIHVLCRIILPFKQCKYIIYIPEKYLFFNKNLNACPVTHKNNRQVLSYLPHEKTTQNK